MGNDFERVVETNEGQQIEPGYIFDGIFVTDAFGQFFVGTYFIAQFADAANEVTVTHFEGGAADGISGIQQGTVHQDNTGGNKHLVAIGVRTAVHAGSIVHDNTAYHGAFHRSGVRCKLAAVGSQQFVHTLSDDARLEDYLFVVGGYAVFFPVLAGYDEDGVTNGLTRQTGPCRSEGDGQPVAARQFQQL